MDRDLSFFGVCLKLVRELKWELIWGGVCSRNECFKLDSFYGQESNPEQVFDKEVFPLLPEVFHGCNATVFAYGATGSGKTYTMQVKWEMFIL